MQPDKNALKRAMKKFARQLVNFSDEEIKQAFKVSWEKRKIDGVSEDEHKRAEKIFYKELDKLRNRN